ncbi:MAG: dimethyl sulfoxide reductase anchor subunit family protein [Eggerthellaceae bacterium]|jgi:DMSO reductase anchor subunit
MEAALQDLPLAIFSTLAPIGAGAFIALFIAFLKRDYTSAELKKVDTFTIIPILVAVIGLCASFAHLTNPGNAMNVASTVGSTPLANEIAVFGVFMILAVVYWICGMAGCLSGKGHKVFTGILAVGAVCVACAIGGAYLLPTIPVWNTIFTPISILGFALSGGALLGMLVLAFAGVADKTTESGAAKPMMGMFCFGVLLSLVGVIAIWVIGANTTSAVLQISAATSSLIWAFVLFIILMIVSCIPALDSIMLSASRVNTAVGVTLVIVAVFLARLCFYGMQFGIGL